MTGNLRLGARLFVIFALALATVAYSQTRPYGQSGTVADTGTANGQSALARYLEAAGRALGDMPADPAYGP